ncbi:hypothetical protein GF345_00990 [Candidatus Woesearchaeota archaeon]|nr:hypothetical protein [Candidatus Woesearchaeota archaeon]
MKNSQSSFEFLLLASLMFLFFTGLLAVIGQQMVNLGEQRNIKDIEDIMEIVRSEIQLAETSMQGYQRSFLLPQTINGREFDMGLIDDTLVILYQGKRYDAFMPGQLLPDTSVYKGENFVEKTGGMIFINSSDPCNELFEGEKSYCLAGTCYCYIGYYDEHCDESQYPGETPDGVLEDDVIVDHCGVDESDAIDCVRPDPCNFPPEFTQGPEYYSTDRNLTVNFTSNEDLSRAYVSYDYCDACNCEDLKLTNHSEAIEDIPAGSLGEIFIDYLLPSTQYCFNVTIIDAKSTPNSSDPIRFTTDPDSTVPQIIDWHYTPSDIYLGSEFNLTLKMYEPSELSGDSMMIINSTDGAFSRQYPINYNYDAGSNMGNYSSVFVVEPDDLDDPANFSDTNASYLFEPGITFFYNLFNHESLAADSSVGIAEPYDDGDPATDFPDLANGRFMWGVDVIETSDCLSYETLDNMDVERGTIQFWVSPHWDDTDTRTFFSEGLLQSRMAIQKVGSEQLRFLIEKGTYEYYITTGDSIDWNTGQWYYIAAVWDFTNPASPYMRLFVDGKEFGDESGEVSGTPLALAADDAAVYFNIGCLRTTPSMGAVNPANAVIDQVRISGAVLTAEEIIDDMAIARKYYIDLYLVDIEQNSIYETYLGEKRFRINYTEKPESAS